jgi:hypothetical protein
VLYNPNSPPQQDLHQHCRAGNAARCEHCGNPLRPKPGSRRQRFCGDVCRQAAHRANRKAVHSKNPAGVHLDPSTDLSRSKSVEPVEVERGDRLVDAEGKTRPDKAKGKATHSINRGGVHVGPPGQPMSRSVSVDRSVESVESIEADLIAGLGDLRDVEPKRRDFWLRRARLAAEREIASRSARSAAEPRPARDDGHVSSDWTPCWPGHASGWRPIDRSAESPSPAARAAAPTPVTVTIKHPTTADDLIARIPADLSIPDFLST